MRHASLATEEDKSASMGHKIARWVDQVLGPSFHQYCPGEAWRPAINLCEDDSHYCLVVDLAGMKGEEIELQIGEGSLILSGERATPPAMDPSGTVRLHLMEIDHGRFSREVKLPDDADLADSDAVQACYRSGFLWVKVPKKKG